MIAPRHNGTGVNGTGKVSVGELRAKLAAFRLGLKAMERFFHQHRGSIPKAHGAWVEDRLRAIAAEVEALIARTGDPPGAGRY
jgi:hypothetical protein